MPLLCVPGGSYRISLSLGSPLGLGGKKNLFSFVRETVFSRELTWGASCRGEEGGRKPASSCKAFLWLAVFQSSLAWTHGFPGSPSARRLWLLSQSSPQAGAGEVAQ